MAFGPKGRPSSAGKPRIPNDAIVTFEVQMEGLPGREEELINIMGDE
jgi:peptidylprolyl isomerase